MEKDEQRLNKPGEEPKEVYRTSDVSRGESYAASETEIKGADQKQVLVDVTQFTIPSYGDKLTTSRLITGNETLRTVEANERIGEQGTKNAAFFLADGKGNSVTIYSNTTAIVQATNDVMHDVLLGKFTPKEAHALRKTAELIIELGMDGELNDADARKIHRSLKAVQRAANKDPENPSAKKDSAPTR